MKHTYYELIEDAVVVHHVSMQFKTYPYTRMFQKYEDIDCYIKAKRAFIQSTKIPESCKKCPIYDTAFMCNGHCGTVMCHLAWRKIWEYVI